MTRDTRNTQLRVYELQKATEKLQVHNSINCKFSGGNCFRTGASSRLPLSRSAFNSCIGGYAAPLIVHTYFIGSSPGDFSKSIFTIKLEYHRESKIRKYN